MKAAFACWQNRIAPVFDVARHVRLVEAANGRIISETDAELPGDSPDEKALHLAGFGVDTLVCGAISRFVQAVIAARGIAVVPFVAGDLRDVMDAWVHEGLDDRAFAMPGCCRWRRGRGRHGRHYRHRAAQTF